MQPYLRSQGLRKGREDGIESSRTLVMAEGTGPKQKKKAAKAPAAEVESYKHDSDKRRMIPTAEQ